MGLACFERLLAPGMERRRVVLQAIDEVIETQLKGSGAATSGEYSATVYFAALLTSLEGDADGSNKNDLAGLLAMVSYSFARIVRVSCLCHLHVPASCQNNLSQNTYSIALV